MTNTYTHPNGYTVKRTADGGLRVFLGATDSTWHSLDATATLRDFFLAELGLWRDDETGALVVVDSWSEDRQGASVIYSGCTWIAQRLSRMPDWDRELLGDVATELDGIITRWRATITPPPREPQSGEVWRITLEDGTSRNVLVQEYATGAVCFEDGSDGGWYVSGFPADRRRLLVEADGTVVAGDD